MAEVPSTRILQIGDPAPGFDLADPTGDKLTLLDVRGPKGLVVAFICNHCPYVIQLAGTLTDFADNCIAKGIGFVAINSNDVSRYPADSPEKMASFKSKYRWGFPYLYDQNQSVAQAYRAACTPDFYVFDQELKLTYCGQFDSSRPGRDIPVTGADLREAVDRVLNSLPPLDKQLPSTGCSIKWKPGNEPEWFLQ